MSLDSENPHLPQNDVQQNDLAEIVPPSDLPQADARNPVDVLAEQFAAEVRQGLNPSIDDYAQRFPNFEQAIRLIFPSIVSVEKISAEEADNRKIERESNRFFQSKLESISDFEIIRELGRGGMGIVYEAIQKSLNRKVALKTINPQIANSPIQLQRFRREAEAAARLQHTHIIQVYGIGEEAGIHFFAMQLVNGCALSDFINLSKIEKSTKVRHRDLTLREAQIHQQSPSQLPVGSRTDLMQPFLDLPVAEYRNWICKLVMDVADALSYAHSNGIFHRDIKPANLLVDENGTVLISDFGLAKFLDFDDVTQAGDLVGTLRYMAPEQFDGLVDERTDIYSLGLTLFELLTRQSAFDGTNKSHAISINEKKNSPPKLRSLDDSFSVDLDTIASKATAPEPEHRYQSAAEFREDLRLVLAGEPIKSRPVTWYENVWRFSKRNPAIAALSTLSIALLFTVAIVGIAGYLQTQKALAGMQSEFSRAESQKTRARENLSIAKSAIQQLLTNLSQRGMFQQRSYRFGDEEFYGTTSRLSQADIDMLLILLDVFKKFSSTNVNEEDLTLETAEANSTVGDIYQKLGRYDDAVDAYSVALEQFQKYNSDAGGESESLLAQAKTMNEIAVTSGLNGDPRAAGNLYTQAKQFFADHRTQLDSAAARFELARTLNIFASTGSRIGQFSFRDFRPRPEHPWFWNSRKSREAFSRETPPKNRSETAPRPPTGPKSRIKFDRNWRMPDFGGKGRGGKREFSQGTQWRGDSRKSKGSGRRFPSRHSGPGGDPWGLVYLKANLEAEQILNQLLELDPENEKYRLALSRNLADRLRLSRQSENRIEREKIVNQIKSIQTSLIQENPELPIYQFELAQTLINNVFGDASHSKTQIQEAVGTAKSLAEKYPEVHEYRALYADSIIKAASIDGRIPNRGGVAELGFEAGLKIYQEITKTHPDAHQFQLAYILHLQSFAELKEKFRKKSEAQKLRQTALEVLNSVGFSDDQSSPASRIKKDLMRKLGSSSR